MVGWGAWVRVGLCLLVPPVLSLPLDPLLQPSIPVLEPALDAALPSAPATSLEMSAAARTLPPREASGRPGERRGIDLARLLIRDPEHSLLLRVAGDSMQGAGIRHGDLLVVERCHEARAGTIVVVRFGGQFTLKRLCQSPGRRWLEAAHPDYPPIPLEALPDSGDGRTGFAGGVDVQLWGVAVHVIRTL